MEATRGSLCEHPEDSRVTLAGNRHKSRTGEGRGRVNHTHKALQREGCKHTGLGQLIESLNLKGNEILLKSFKKHDNNQICVFTRLLCL